MGKFLLLLIAGAGGYVAAFPPLDFPAAGLVSLAALGLAFREPVRFGLLRWLLVYAAGVALFAAGCGWLADLHPSFPFIMAVFEGLALPLFCLFFRLAVLPPAPMLPAWAALPVAWCAVEYLRSVFPLDGFPWLLLGYVTWHWTPMIQIADLTGVFGLSFLWALAAGVAVSWYASAQSRDAAKERRPVVGTVALVVLLAATAAYGWLRPRGIEVQDGPIVAAVQGNIPQELKDDSDLAGELLSRYTETTKELFRPDETEVPSLVIWPETVFPYPLGEGKIGDSWFPHYGYAESLRAERLFLVSPLIDELLAPHGSWFLTGVQDMRVNAKGVLEKRNAAYLYDPLGDRKSIYTKTLLVPGGEYLPFVRFLPFRKELEAIVLREAHFLPDLDPGFGPTVMRFSEGGQAYRFGVQICYENIYGDYNRRFVKEGAQFMVNLSNEGWFRSPSEFDQMLAMSVFRAVETRRALFRSTNTGISCLIGPRGGVPAPEDRIREGNRDRNVRGVLVRRIPLCEAGTVYVAVGDLFARVVFFGQIIFLPFLLLRKRRGKRSTLKRQS